MFTVIDFWTFYILELFHFHYLSTSKQPSATNVFVGTLRFMSNILFAYKLKYIIHEVIKFQQTPVNIILYLCCLDGRILNPEL